jgi:hypothetical protein
MSLQAMVRSSWAQAALKHGLCKNGETPEEYADRRINELTPAELLERVSNALEEIEAQKGT